MATALDFGVQGSRGLEFRMIGSGVLGLRGPRGLKDSGFRV